MSYKLTYKLGLNAEPQPTDETLEQTYNTKEEAEDAALLATIGDFGCTFYNFRINGEPADLYAAENRDKLKQQGLS